VLIRKLRKSSFLKYTFFDIFEGVSNHRIIFKKSNVGFLNKNILLLILEGKRVEKRRVLLGKNLSNFSQIEARLN